MVTLEQFTSVTHNREQVMGSLSIGLKSALSIAQDIDWAKMEELANASRVYLPAVNQELATLRAAHAANPDRMARRAILFGLSTPNRDEAQSVSWALHADSLYDVVQDNDTLVRLPYPSPVHGRPIKLGFYSSMVASLEYVRALPGYQLTLEQIEAIPGAGPKVARMIQAVMRPDAKNWTVDVWHMRQLLWAAGRDFNVRVVCGNPGYKVLEALWLEYAERYFPGEDMFAVQWATWNVADGRFNSHAALWQDLVS